MKGVLELASAIYQVELPGFPDWAVPMTRIVPIVQVSAAYTAFNPVVSSEIFCKWKKVDNSTYLLTIYLEATATYTIVEDDTLNAPMIIDIEMIIVNERNYFITQTEGK